MKKQTIGLLMMTLAMSAPAFASRITNLTTLQTTGVIQEDTNANSTAQNTTTQGVAKFATKSFDTKEEAGAWLSKHINADEQVDDLVFTEKSPSVGQPAYAVVVALIYNEFYLLKNDFTHTVRVTDTTGFPEKTQTTQDMKDLINNYRAANPTD